MLPYWTLLTRIFHTQWLFLSVNTVLHLLSQLCAVKDNKLLLFFRGTKLWSRSTKSWWQWTRLEEGFCRKNPKTRDHFPWGRTGKKKLCWNDNEAQLWHRQFVDLFKFCEVWVPESLVWLISTAVIRSIALAILIEQVVYELFRHGSEESSTSQFAENSFGLDLDCYRSVQLGSEQFVRNIRSLCSIKKIRQREGSFSTTFSCRIGGQRHTNFHCIIPQSAGTINAKQYSHSETIVECEIFGLEEFNKEPKRYKAKN